MKFADLRPSDCRSSHGCEVVDLEEEPGLVPSDPPHILEPGVEDRLALARDRAVDGDAIAWTMIVGGIALMGNRGALKAAAAGDVWVAYPLNPAPGQRMVIVVWIVLSLVGAGVQLGITGGEKGRVVKRKKKA